MFHFSVVDGIAVLLIIGGITIFLILVVSGILHIIRNAIIRYMFKHENLIIKSVFLAEQYSTAKCFYWAHRSITDIRPNYFSYKELPLDRLVHGLSVVNSLGNF